MAEHHILDFDPSAGSAYTRIRHKAGLHIVDRLEDILTELYKAEYPDPDNRPIGPDEFRLRELNGSTPEAYGKWVYYPWRETLVHIPDEETFIRLRTVRNLYKITPEESRKLRQSKIGVIGLSVGHSVSMAIAMERIAGEIRIADFDTLELGNMNRIRTGLHNLGIPKTTIVAREIAEIDPYLKVTCFPGGIDKDNIEAFFDEGGRLDVLVEECDSVEVKILARQVAKRKRVPVVMDTSDRLMIDIERFDLDPNYPIMHGMVDENLDYDFLKSLKSSKDKLPYILPFAGIDQISDRMAASALELGTSITSWPQLATEVQIGGALAARNCRNIILRPETINGGRYYHEGNDQLSTVPYVQFEKSRYSRKREIPISFTVDNNGFKRNSLLESILQEAICSPSAANLQNWKFYINDNKIILCFEKDYNTSVFDTNSLYSYIGLSIVCSAISIIASKHGLRSDVRIHSYDNPTIEILFYHENIQVDWRYEYLKKRYTNRAQYTGSKVDQSILDSISEEFSSENIHHISQDNTIDQLEEVIGEFDSLRLLNAQTHNELFDTELRISKYHPYQSQAGLYVEDLLLSSSDQIGVQISKRVEVMNHLKTVNLTGPFSKISRSLSQNKDSYVVITGKLNTLEEIFETSKIVLDYWIHCTRSRLSLHPVTSPIPILNNLKRSNCSPFYKQSDKIRHLQHRLLSLCSVQDQEIAFIAKVKMGIEEYSRVREKLLIKIQYI